MKHFISAVCIIVSHHKRQLTSDMSIYLIDYSIEMINPNFHKYILLVSTHNAEYALIIAMDSTICSSLMVIHKLA